ncbi:MAG: hypothetical protein COV44_10195 [Deltaproteobacteria bacterium CG11_big_fil_rev_8_21_14_0_20_45_16]|nr:MAG: hypothetical protein COV44_10195 [Deltaproteobacteria bacterium CG11_big_fil_rev_8_21_14_0_20_45_16]
METSLGFQNIKEDKLSGEQFLAKHPMFRYEASESVDEAFRDRVVQGKKFVVVGQGGSVLPLKVFVDAFGLWDEILIWNTMDQVFAEHLLKYWRDSDFILVSKSGETLELQATLRWFMAKGIHKDKILVVTDREKGPLRNWAGENSVPSCSIPSEIGGRFTNFILFHELLLKRFGVDLNVVRMAAKENIEGLKANPKILEMYFQMLMANPQSQGLILWAYGERLLGLAQWIQQVLAESLGKINKFDLRVGKLPTVLIGPQDQHSVLQFLHQGPNNHLLWFFDWMSDVAPSGLAKVMSVLSESCYQSFHEKLEQKGSQQDLIRWRLTSDLNKDLGEAISFVQAFVEYAGGRLGINAFDQPGVERGKKIALDLMAHSKLIVL